MATERKVTKTESALTVANEQDTVLHQDKTDKLIVAQAKKLNIDLMQGDVKAIKGTLLDSYTDQARLKVAVVQAIVRYQQQLEAGLNTAMAQALQGIQNHQNASNRQQKANLEALANAAKENKDMWQEIADDMLKEFSAPPTFDIEF
jgi:hypothetical protein